MTEFHSTIDDERRNFRVPVQEKSFLYPVDGSWKGRRTIETIDLSCGGISFYSDPGMNSGDIAEVVIPMTANPLLLQIKLLRKDEVTAERARYAAKFVVLQPDSITSPFSLILNSLFAFTAPIAPPKPADMESAVTLS